MTSVAKGNDVTAISVPSVCLRSDSGSVEIGDLTMLRKQSG